MFLVQVLVRTQFNWNGATFNGPCKVPVTDEESFERLIAILDANNIPYEILKGAKKDEDKDNNEVVANSNQDKIVIEEPTEEGTDPIEEENQQVAKTEYENLTKKQLGALLNVDPQDYKKDELVKMAYEKLG